MPRLLLLIILGGFAMLCTPAAADDHQGFLYGTLTLQSGDQHSGFLRWRDEEAFWDDLFHSRQDSLPWFQYVDLDELKKERRNRYYETHGLIDRLMYSLHSEKRDLNPRRLFISRFGDLESITIDAEENVTVVLRDGRRQPVRGYSNDVSSDILVYGDTAEPLVVEWDDLARIDFQPPPEGAVAYATRLYGRVRSVRGEFEGFIQWDQSECTSIDVLDGNDRDVVIGEVRSIRRNRENESDFVLKNGETFSLGGSNDVDGGNRGIVVQTATLGRVNIPWNRFEEIEFLDGFGSGPGRDGFPPNAPLQGTVTDQEGQRHEGRIVWDLDEAWTGDIFNGKSEDIDYNLPFGLIRQLENTGDTTCRVTLVDGKTLALSDNMDTGDQHAGVLIFPMAGGDPLYLLWSRFSSLAIHP